VRDVRLPQHLIVHEDIQPRAALGAGTPSVSIELCFLFRAPLPASFSEITGYGRAAPKPGPQPRTEPGFTKAERRLRDCVPLRVEQTQ
jgi:hypothetical protein